MCFEHGAQDFRELESRVAIDRYRYDKTANVGECGDRHGWHLPGPAHSQWTATFVGGYLALACYSSP